MGSAISTIYTFFRPLDDERADEPSDFSNVMAQIFLWTLLAGFLVLPSTFTNVQKSVVCSNTLTEVVRDVRNISAVAIGFTCCGIGTTGLCVLWWIWRRKYAWLLGTIFIPGLFHGLSGIISTFVSLYGVQNICDGLKHGVHYGPTTIATVAATSGCSIICFTLALIYGFLKRSERKELKKSQGGQEGGGNS